MDYTPTQSEIASVNAQTARDEIKALRAEVLELRAAIELLYSIRKGPEQKRTITRIYPSNS
jgi:hypothetical protein